MKKAISFITAVIICATFVSCQSRQPKDNPADSSEAPSDVTTETEKQENAENNLFDFSSVRIDKENCFVLSKGGTKQIDDGGSLHFYSSDKSVITVDEIGLVFAVSDGVALIACVDAADSDASDCYAVCVLPDGKSADPSAAHPLAYESGTSELLMPEMMNSTFSSSDECIVSLSQNKLIFGRCGYAVVTVTSASVPHIFSYIVYSRS